MKLMSIGGLKIADATCPLTVHITARDIKGGRTKTPSNCAAARALVRETGCEEARVHIGRTYLKRGGKWVRYLTPRDLRDEIISFDRGGSFEPGKFTLKAVPTWLRSPHGKARPEGSRNRTGKRRSRHMVANVRPHGANR